MPFATLECRSTAHVRYCFAAINQTNVVLIIQAYWQESRADCLNRDAQKVIVLL